MPTISTEDYVHQRRLKLGDWVMARERVYLDKRFWIYLRDARLGRPAPPAASALLEALTLGVREGRQLCPVSDVLFMELMKQADLSTRSATAELMDDLSCGVTLVPHPERVATEVEQLLSPSTACGTHHRLEARVWSKVSYIFGISHRNLPRLTKAQQHAVQQAFFEYMWNIPLARMIADLGTQEFPAAPYPDLVNRLNEGNAAHADEMRSFPKVYKDEVYGALEAALPIVGEVLGRMAVNAGYSQEMSATERDSFNQEAYAFLCAAINKDDVRRALRTLHIGASLHAGVRWKRRQKLVPNDLYDFHHAEAGVGYCDVFLTDGPMHALLVQHHLGIEQDFPCRIMSAWDEILDWAQKSSTTVQPS